LIYDRNKWQNIISDAEQQMALLAQCFNAKKSKKKIT
jgi:hypothetical protein